MPESRHVSDGSSFEPNENQAGFHTARCQCARNFGPLPDIETVTDVLMEHAYERAMSEHVIPTVAMGGA